MLGVVFSNNWSCMALYSVWLQHNTMLKQQLFTLLTVLNNEPLKKLCDPLNLQTQPQLHPAHLFKLYSNLKWF